MSEPLDIEDPVRLLAWLRSEGHIGPAESVHIRVLRGGVSNRTVHVRRDSGEAWVLKQALEQLRVSVTWRSSPLRVHREAMGMRWLPRLAPENAIPRLVFEDSVNHVIAMEAVPEPHDNWKDALLRGSVDPEAFRQAAVLIRSIHQGSRELEDVVSPHFADRSFFESLRLEPFYEYSAARNPGMAGFLGALLDDTRRSASALVHGDFSPKNILIHNSRLVLLDHEVIHWGDPMFDLGFFAAHILSKVHAFPRSGPALLSGLASFWEVYREGLSSLPDAEWQGALAVRHALGCLLARASGRSQVEYLSPLDKERQARVVETLARLPLRNLSELGNEFAGRVG